MRQRLLMLVKIHHERPPVKITARELTMVDMVGVYLAVFAKVWYAEEVTREQSSSRLSPFIDLLQRAEQSEGLDTAEAQEFLAARTSRNENCDSVDLEQNAMIEQRINKVLPAVNEAASKCRKRTKTDRFVNQQPARKPAAVMRKRSKPSPPPKSPEATPKKSKPKHVTCPYAVDDEVMCLKSDEEDGWFHATVIGVHKNNTFNVRFAPLPRVLHILHYDPNFVL